MLGEGSSAPPRVTSRNARMAWRACKGGRLCTACREERDGRENGSGACTRGVSSSKHPVLTPPDMCSSQKNSSFLVPSSRYVDFVVRPPSSYFGIQFPRLLLLSCACCAQNSFLSCPPTRLTWSWQPSWEQLYLPVGVAPFSSLTSQQCTLPFSRPLIHSMAARDIPFNGVPLVYDVSFSLLSLGMSRSRC